MHPSRDFNSCSSKLSEIHSLITLGNQIIIILRLLDRMSLNKFIQDIRACPNVQTVHKHQCGGQDYHLTENGRLNHYVNFTSHNRTAYISRSTASCSFQLLLTFLFLPVMIAGQILVLLDIIRYYLTVSVNGLQFLSNMFKTFSQDFNFKHVTSSPHHPSGSRQAECG